MALKSDNEKTSNESKNNQENCKRNPQNTEITKTSRTNKHPKHRASLQVPTLHSNDPQHQPMPANVPLVPVIPTMIPVTTMAMYFPQYGCLSYPAAVDNWNVVQIQNPVHNVTFQSMPLLVTPQIMAPICPYILGTPPIIAPVVPQPLIIDELPMSNYLFDNVSIYSPEQIVPANEVNLMKGNDAIVYETVKNDLNVDPLEVYLSLPRELFPTGRMLVLDPNPLIDEFCRFVDIHSHVSWILDLEFGVPRTPTTRPIARYDVKFNSVHCKNTPDAIHPGFEGCSQEFKEVLLFYYDCVISAWYKSYILLDSAGSVENFQSWLSLPMQKFGMCWR